VGQSVVDDRVASSKKKPRVALHAKKKILGSSRLAMMPRGTADASTSCRCRRGARRGASETRATSSRGFAGGQKFGRGLTKRLGRSSGAEGAARWPGGARAGPTVTHHRQPLFPKRAIVGGGLSTGARQWNATRAWEGRRTCARPTFTAKVPFCCSVAMVSGL